MNGLMNIIADATLPGALSTFKYDDEGTPAQRLNIVDSVNNSAVFQVIFSYHFSDPSACER